MARTEDRPPAIPLRDTGVRVAIVCSGFHRGLAERLLDGARERLAESGLPAANVEVHWVPGAYESPYAAKVLADSGRVDGIVAVGAVVRGATPHFDHVCFGASQGLMRVAIDTGVPCTFGILTCDTVEQAWARAGGEVGNAGSDAADAVVSLINLRRQVAAGA